MTPAMVPMIAPDGSYGEVPQARVQDAISAGGKIGVWFKAPNGSTGIIPRENVPAAVKAGGTPFGSFAALQQAQQLDREQSAPRESGLGAFGRDLAGIAGSVLSSPVTAMEAFRNPTSGMQMGGQVAFEDLQRKQEGRSLPYRAIAPVGTVAGMNVRGMEEAANQGNTAAVFGHAAAPVAAAVAPFAIRGATRAAGNAFTEAQTSAVRSTVPEASTLPADAVAGTEKIYRAAAPVGSDPQFRSNLYAAAGDLAEIGRKVNMAESKGGVIQPDMRVRATVDAINDHLRDIYQQEHAPQIARNADAQVAPKFSPDATEALDYLSRNAGTSADRALAQHAMSSETLPLAQMDELRSMVNRELSPLRGMTPQELAAAEGSRRLSSLQALDGDISQAIGTELENRGEPGLSWERRYSALSQVRDRLQRQINYSELRRDVPGLRQINALRKPSIAGASQAATANVNIGRMLQKGLSQLADSGIQPARSVGSGAPPVRGLLGPGATELGSRMEPIGEPSQPPPVEPTTRAQRKGLLLPEKASIERPIRLGSSIEPVGEPSAPQPVMLRPLDPIRAQDYINAAGGNRTYAQQLAERDGYTLEQTGDDFWSNPKRWQSYLPQRF